MIKFLRVLLILPLIISCSGKKNAPVHQQSDSISTTVTSLSKSAVLTSLLQSGHSNDSVARMIADLPEDTSKVNSLFALVMQVRTKDSIASTAYAHYMLFLSEELKFTEGEAKAYYLLGRIAIDWNSHKEALGFLKKGVELSAKADYETGTMNCYYWIARCYRRIADYPNYQKYLALLEQQSTKLNNKRYLSYAYEGYGNLYRYVGDYSKSIDYYMKAIGLSEKLGNLEDESTALNNMSLVYEYQGKVEDELNVQLRNYAILQKLGKSSDMALCLSNLSATYSLLGRNEKAVEFINKSMALINEMRPENLASKDVASAYGQFASVAAASGNYDTALVYYQKDFQLRKIQEDKKAISDCYGNMAHVYSLKNDNAHAEEFLEKQLAITQEIGYRNGQMSAYMSMAELKEKQGDYQNAYFSLQKYTRLSDSLSSVANAEQANEIENRFKVQEQQQQIELLSRDKVMQSLELERRKIISYTLGIGLFLIFLLVLVGFRGYRQKQRINRELEKKVEQRTLALTQRNKDLKDFIYKSSHDIRSPIASVKGLINIARSDLSDPKVTLDLLEKISGVVEKQDTTLHSLLKISRLIEGKIETEKINIKMLFDDVLDNLRILGQEKNVDTIIMVKDDLDIYTDRTAFISIVQNLVSNGIKYSRRQADPSYVKLEASEHRSGVLIRVSDNGEGISEDWKEKVFEMFTRASVTEKGSGLGLYIVRNSVEILKGTIAVESEVRIGSTFSIWLPQLYSGIGKN